VSELVEVHMVMLPITLPCVALVEPGSSERCGHDAGVTIGQLPTCRHHLLIADELMGHELLQPDDPPWVAFDACPKDQA
jgi:hypothetical protein